MMTMDDFEIGDKVQTTVQLPAAETGMRIPVDALATVVRYCEYMGEDLIMITYDQYGDYPHLVPPHTLTKVHRCHFKLFVTAFSFSIKAQKWMPSHCYRCAECGKRHDVELRDPRPMRFARAFIMPRGWA